MTLSIWPDGQIDRNFPFSYTYTFFVNNNDPIKQINFGTFVYKSEYDLIFAKYRSKKLTFSELNSLKKTSISEDKGSIENKKKWEEIGAEIKVTTKIN
jgi:hypothetical protein